MSNVLYHWAADCDIASLYPGTMKMASSEYDFVGSDFAFAKITNGKVMVKLMHKDARDFVKEATGTQYRTIILTEDDPLLSMIMLKFKGRQET
jgi:hypothetical protein